MTLCEYLHLLFLFRRMGRRLLVMLICCLVFVKNVNGEYNVPIQPGVKNTISFDISSLGEGSTKINNL